MQKLKIKQISLAVCLALMPLASFSAGLGPLSLSSAIGEPFKAEIELLSVTPTELLTLAATIASEEAYAEQGIVRLGIHNDIKIEVAKNAAGQPILKLRSNQAISDPYLDMLIQVDWASGRLQREYTILLDLPEDKTRADLASSLATSAPVVNSAVTSQPATTSPSQSADVNNNKVSTKKSSSIKPSAQKSADSLSASPAATKYGDTLYSMAKELQVEGVSLDQMLIGLYESNQEAFSGNNMNRLKVGRIIKVPTKEILSAVDTQQASQQVKVHSANWGVYRDSLAAKVAAAPAQQTTAQKQVASGKIATAADKSIPVKKGPQAVVKLSAGEKGVEATQDLKAKNSVLQDEAAAREKSLKEAQERTAVLEQQIVDMQKLLALKNQAMSDAQKTAAQAVAESKTVTVTSKAVAAEKAATEVVAAKPVKSAPLIPELEPSLWKRLINWVDLTLLAALASMGLLAAAWMILRNKRRKGLDNFERGILMSGGLNTSTVFGNTSGRNSTTDSSFLTDFVRSADGSMIDTHDVDPIAEAEVYMAYGRDAQAEEILKDAISKEPLRYELQLKLLEMYAAKKDPSAFEVIAGELYSKLGADDATWKKVAALGLTFDSENPLYNVDKSALTSATEKLDVSDFAADSSTDNALDFPVDIAAIALAPETKANVVVQQSFSAAKLTESELTFDLGSAPADVEANVSQAPAASNFANMRSEIEPSQEVQDQAAQNNLAQADIATTNINKQLPSEEKLKRAADNALGLDLAELNTTKIEATTLPEKTEDEAVAIEPAQTTDNNTATNVLDLSAMNTNTASQANDFDMDFDVPAEVPANSMASLEQKSELVADAIQDISFDFEAEEPVKAVVAQSDNNASDLSFDLSASSDNVRPDVVAQNVEPRANELDLSAISFDLDEAAVTKPSNAVSSSAVTEAPEVEIKLDLVAAYMDMGDKEGARELLEEVVKEGGEQQRLRAEILLTRLS